MSVEVTWVIQEKFGNHWTTLAEKYRKAGLACMDCKKLNDEGLNTYRVVQVTKETRVITCG